MATGRIYHFKHGWIPVDHAAAGEAKSHSALLLHRAEIMHGSDRSKWSGVNLATAAKHGDASAKVELAKRKKSKTKKTSAQLLAAKARRS